MTFFFSYLLGFGGVLALLTVFYWIVLSRETFFTWNRSVLLGIAILALILPILPFPTAINQVKDQVLTDFKHETGWIKSTETENTNIEPIIKPQHEGVDTQQKEVTFKTFSIFYLLQLVYWFGVILLLIRFLVQLASIYRLIRINEVKRGKKYHLVNVTQDIAPYSFGKFIFMNPNKYSEDQFFQILNHEKIHIRLWHTFDLLIAELIIAVQWFNPFAWLLRYFIVQNIEYQVDNELLKEEEDKKSYQYHLLKIAVPNYPLSITTNYNQSLIKNRIKMMNKKKSSVSVIYKYLLIIPAALFIFMAIQPLEAQTVGYGKVVSGKAVANGYQSTSTVGVGTSKIKERNIFLVVSNDIKMETLRDAERDLAKEGLYVTFSNIDFNSNGKIANIQVQATDKKGFNGNLNLSFDEEPNTKIYIYRIEKENGDDYSYGLGHGVTFDKVRDLPEKVRVALRAIKKGYIIGSVTE